VNEPPLIIDCDNANIELQKATLQKLNERFGNIITESNALYYSFSFIEYFYNPFKVTTDLFAYSKYNTI
jgi:hypothetical protein